VVLAEDLDEVERLGADDPAVRLSLRFQVETVPFLRLVTPGRNMRVNSFGSSAIPQSTRPTTSSGMG